MNMNPILLQSLCPCGSALKYAECCAPLHQNKKLAATAEELLRARYCAFPALEIDFVVNTHHSRTRAEINRSDIETWAKGSKWLGLSIHEKEAGLATDTKGSIVFCARYETQGKAQEHWEKALFEKEGQEWRFVDVESAKLGTVKRTEPKVGRNDPCSCGSGKKFKKCHGSGAAATS